MKINQLIAAALVAVGLVSAASAATTLSGGSGTTNVVFMTGSTAFRGNIYNTVTNNAIGNDGTLFDTNFPVVVAQPSGAAVGVGTSIYYASGKIGGNYYIISFDFTGSEAGIASVAGATVTQTLPANAAMGLAAGTYNIPNATPTIAFFLPGGANPPTALYAPDLAMADTSQAVSLTKTPVLTEYGIVGVVNFVWAKGKNTAPDSSWNNLGNVTIPNLLTLAAGSVSASFFTGNSADTDPIYLIGRNKGSGTRVNMFLDLTKPLVSAVGQYAYNSAYSAAGKLSFNGTYPAITGVGDLKYIANDGYESGGDVSKVLSCNINGKPLITLGYMGINDALAARDGSGSQPAGAVWLTQDGVPFNNGNVEIGAYPFWGHEHLYGRNGQLTTDVGGIVAQKFASTSSYPDISTYQSGTARGAIALYGQLGGATASAQDNGIDAAYMACDKTGDTGYPTQF